MDMKGQSRDSQIVHSPPKKTRLRVAVEPFWLDELQCGTGKTVLKYDAGRNTASFQKMSAKQLPIPSSDRAGGKSKGSWVSNDHR